MGIFSGLVLGILADTEIRGCLSPLCKMASRTAHSWPFSSADSQLWTENTTFNPQLAESMDAKPEDTGRLYIEKNPTISGHVQFKHMLLKGQL